MGGGGFVRISYFGWEEEAVEEHERPIEDGKSFLNPSKNGWIASSPDRGSGT